MNLLLFFYHVHPAVCFLVVCDVYVLKLSLCLFVLYLSKGNGSKLYGFTESVCAAGLDDDWYLQPGKGKPVVFVFYLKTCLLDVD